DAAWIRTDGEETSQGKSDALAVVKFRVERANGSPRSAREFPLRDDGRVFAAASPDFQFAAAVAGFGLLLRDTPEGHEITAGRVTAWAQPGLLEGDASAQRADFVELVRAATALLPVASAGSS